MKRLLEIEKKLDEASEFTAKYHRHSKPLRRHKFTIGAIEQSKKDLDTWSDQYLGIVTVDTCS